MQQRSVVSGLRVPEPDVTHHCTALPQSFRGKNMATADAGEPPSPLDNSDCFRPLSLVKEENGSLSSEADGSTESDQALPRRSSLIKDTTRRRSRKKTVSFSTFPEERQISTGKWVSPAGTRRQETGFRKAFDLFRDKKEKPQ